MKATWNNEVIANSDETVVVEGNHYFPPDSVRKEYLQPSSTHTTCSWKCLASYYNLVVNGETNKDAAWYYPGAERRGGRNYRIIARPSVTEHTTHQLKPNKSQGVDSAATL